MMRRTTTNTEPTGTDSAGGLGVWLLERLRRAPRPRPRLVLLERVTLAPRQSLALVEAEGRRFLVATSHEGGPVFYALDQQEPPTGEARRSGRAGVAGRITW